MKNEVSQDALSDCKENLVSRSVERNGGVRWYSQK